MINMYDLTGDYIEIVYDGLFHRSCIYFLSAVLCLKASINVDLMSFGIFPCYCVCLCWGVAVGSFFLIRQSPLDDLQVDDIHQADFCKITPAKFCGSKEIVPLEFRKKVSSIIIYIYIVE